ncbi:hypothetical protein PISMIDRAFT_653839, partial [Pisolithus microcarpus 441]
WVNDYHLMLLPGLHVAFPSSEIFRCLSACNSLLKGVLSADLVGFQIANYARHFRQTTSHILAYESLPKGIQVKGHFVDVGVFPMGIDAHSLTEKKRSPEVQYWVQLLRQRCTGMKLIVGRDKLDRIQVSCGFFTCLSA